jgi:hypothetical protein
MVLSNNLIDIFLNDLYNPNKNINEEFLSKYIFILSISIFNHSFYKNDYDFNFNNFNIINDNNFNEVKNCIANSVKICTNKQSHLNLLNTITLLRKYMK